MADEQESTADQAYEWFIRGLYAALILGNLLLIWDSYKDSPSGIELRARVGARWNQLKDCEGCARRREWFRKQAAHVLWDATEIVEEAAAQSEGDA